MKVKTAQNHRERARIALLDLVNRAKTLGLTMDQMVAERKQIEDSLDKCPSWVLDYCRGYYDALCEQMSQYLVFGYTLPDGTVLTTRESRPDYHVKHGLGPQDVYKKATHTGHYWSINGKLKPFDVKVK